MLYNYVAAVESAGAWSMRKWLTCAPYTLYTVYILQ